MNALLGVAGVAIRAHLGCTRVIVATGAEGGLDLRPDRRDRCARLSSVNRDPIPAFAKSNPSSTATSASRSA